MLDLGRGTVDNKVKMQAALGSLFSDAFQNSTNLVISSDPSVGATLPVSYEVGTFKGLLLQLCTASPLLSIDRSIVSQTMPP